jgi:hypothetical protein
MGIGLDLMAKDHENKLKKSGNVLTETYSEVLLRKLINSLLESARGKRREKNYTVNLPMFPVDGMRT